MNCRRVRLGKDHCPALRACLKVFSRPGSVVAVPTETVYGLVCRWDDRGARERIFRMKGRDEEKRLQLLASSPEDLSAAGLVRTPLLDRLLERFCPGPLMLVAPTIDGGSIGFRIPAHDFIRELARSLEGPLAATSANASGFPPASDADAAIEGLAEAPDLLIDGGSTDGAGIASTIVDICGEKPVILRRGLISEEDIISAT